MIPSPFVVPHTDRFDGADGKWTSFYLNVGSKKDNTKSGGQNFRVLISTSSAFTIVPFETTWCMSELCTDKRGLEEFKNKRPTGFEIKELDHYRLRGHFALPKYYGDLPSQFGEGGDVRAQLGFSTVGLGKSGPDNVLLPEQPVAATLFKDYFMGQFGLGTVDFEGAIPSFLTVFEKENKIPSLSYAYTAGAYYRKEPKGVRGSLILGGYDKTRFRDDIEDPTMPLVQPNNTLIVTVQNVYFSPDPARSGIDRSFTAGTKFATFKAEIDSTYPFLFLPGDLCDKFRDEFDLTYDKSSELYFVNETSHQSNRATNASIKISIGVDSKISSKFTTIELPYAAFVHNMDASLHKNNGTRYFPIKNSTDGVFRLGRTFLQEAYIIVDYEKRNFTVKQVTWPESTPSQTVVPIIARKWANASSTSTTTSVPPPPPPPAGGGGGLSGGAIAGIVIAILVSLGCLGLGAFCYRKKKRNMEHKYASELHGDHILASDLIKYGHELPGSPGYYGRETKDGVIPELESPPPQPVEMPSPPIGSATPSAYTDAADYFAVGPGRNMVQRSGAKRESTGNNTPGSIAAELAADGSQHFDTTSPLVSPLVSPLIGYAQPVTNSHQRGPSDTSTNIDQVINPRSRSRSPPEAGVPLETQQPEVTERRPSHTRGLSDTTVRSDSTGVSNPSADDLEVWDRHKDEPMRPLSE